MKKLKYAFITALVFSFLLTACGKEKETYDLSPDSMIEHAFESTEDSFFTDWGIDKEAAKKDESTGSVIYTLDQNYELNGQKGQVLVQFDEGKWSGVTYQFLFSDTDSYLEDAYKFLYQYDKELNETYGEPQDANGSTFLKSNPNFDEFCKNIEENNTKAGLLCFNMGDIYEVDSNVISATMTADQENAMVTITIFEYKYRPLLN